MKHVPDNCLAHYELQPQTHLRNLSTVNAKLFANNVKEYRNGLGYEAEVSPDREAIEFYLLNHLSSLVKEKFTKHEVLPVWAANVMRAYKDCLSNQGIRMTAYMALVCARESRHLRDMGSSWWKKFNEKYGPECEAFHKRVHGKGSSGAADVFIEKNVNTGIGNLIWSFEHIFDEGNFGGGYGGKPWGMIARTLRQFLHGDTTQEMMVDTAYTLAHNNGPMFNKGMLYDHYSSEFIKYLDIQRGGQMPEFMLTEGASHVSGEVNMIWNMAYPELKNEFGTYVDWHKIKKAGGLWGGLGSEIAHQEKKYGKPKEEQIPTTFNGKAATIIGEYKIAPGVGVQMVSRAS